MSRFVCFAVLIGVASSAATAEDGPGLLPEDYYRQAKIESVALSPDGRLLAYTVVTVDEEKNKRNRAIWMQPLKNGDPDGEAFQFTSPASSASSPVWSPGGSLLSFQSKRGEDENTTWFARVAAPGGEAFHIEGVDSLPMWSPDGSLIAMVKEPKDPESATGGEESSEGKSDGKPAAKRQGRDGGVSPDAVR